MAWPLIASGGFWSAAFGTFMFSGMSAAEAADAALAVLAGMRPQFVSFSEVESIHPGVVIGLYFGGLVVRIFLIAYWAAYFVRRNIERSELGRLRRQLKARMHPETAELPNLPRTIHWN
jgi:hypothetical protein